MVKKNKTRLARAAMTLLFALLTTVGAWAQTIVEIGDGGTTNNSYLPGYNYYNYSLTQQIYTAEEIGMAGTINSIAFKNTGAEKTRTYKIYMLLTDKVTFADGNDWVAMSDGDLVFSGELTFAVGEWTTINLDASFAYDGTSNLIVGVADVTGGYSSSPHMACLVFAATGQAIRAYRDASAYDIANPGVTGTVLNVKNQIQLDITPGSGATCAKPSTFEVPSITSSGATFVWEDTGADSYTFEYKKASDSDWVVEAVTSNTYSLSSLTPGTAYNARVKAVCGTDLESGYKTVSFTTMLGIPLIEGFATTSIPTGWTRYNTLLTDEVLTGTTPLQSYSGGWYFGTANGVFDSHARLNIYGTSCMYWLVTPSIMMENNVQLTFDLALTKYSGTLQAIDPTQQSDDKFVVLITTDGGTTWTVLRQWDNTGSEYVYNNIACSATGQNVAIDLSSYAGRNVAIAFYGESTETNNGDNNLHIDNVSIDYIPDCAKPTGLAASDVTAHEVTITWTSDADAWQIMLNDDEENLIDVTEKPYTLSNLTPETTYSVKVRTNCGDNGYSDWTNPVSFTTDIACTAPTDVTVSNITGHGVTITWTAVEGAMFQCAMVKTTEYDANNINWSESFEGNTQSWSNLDPETGYTFALRKNCGSVDGYSQSVTKTFTTTVACPAPTVSVRNITMTTAEVSCTNTEADHFNVMLGEDVVDEGVAMPYTLTDLVPSTSYTVKVQAICGGEDGESAWSNGTPFTTADECPEGMVCIGTGTATSNNVPAHNYFNYSLTQQIYTAAEIGQAGAILSIDFFKASTTEMVKDLDIYIVSTDKDEFTGTSDWIPVTESDKVFSGTVTFTNNDWTTIELDNPFVYDGTSNICIVVDNNTGDYKSNTPFLVFTAEKSQTIYQQSDGLNLDPTTTLTTSGSIMTSKNRIRLGIGEPPACPKPNGLAVNYEDGNTATVTWNGEATSYNIDVNGTVTEGVTSPYTLEGLELATTYEVKVQADCGGAQSDWTSPVSFTTDWCLPEDKCEITFALTDSYGDGWNGSYIDVVDVTTGTSLGHMSNQNVAKAPGSEEAEGTKAEGAKAAETETYTLAVCDGREIQFVWHSGSYDYECSYVVTDINGEEIFSGSGAMSEPVNYTVNCTVTTCRRPTDLAATEIGPHSAKLSWTENGEATAWVVAYKIGDANFTEVDAGENPYTLTGLSTETEYTVKVRPVCEVEKWSDEITFSTEIAAPAPTNVAAGNITSTSAEISWTGNADAASYNLRYREVDPSNMATVILTAGDVWGDGSGYQMLLDADATAYGTIIPENGGLTSEGNASADTYAEFEFKIPINADGALSTSNIVLDNSISIQIPAGTYDWCVTNPTPDDRMWIASENGNVGGRYDDYEFEAGKIYEFTVSLGGENDQVDVTITDGAKAIALGEANQWTTVSDATSPYSVSGLTPATPYEVQVQAVYDEDNSDWTGIYFPTLDVASIHFAKEGYATYYNGLYDLLLPAGMQAKIVTAGDSEGTLSYQTIANGSGTVKNVPSKTAVLLQVAPTSADNPQTQDFELNLASGTTGSYTDNKLHGSDERVYIPDLDDYSENDYFYYMLSYDTSGANIGWYWDKDNTDGTGFWSGAHKAWLALPKSVFQGSGAPFLGLPGWEETTGIVPVGVNPEDGEWYTLQGLKIGKKPTTKGVYIHNGRKFVIK